MPPKTAAAKGAQGVRDVGRKRKSKSRTQVYESSSEESSDTSDTSDTSSSGEESSSAQEQDDAQGLDKNISKPNGMSSEAQDGPARNSLQSSTQANSADAPQRDFSAFYLRSAASEFAEDLDKVRSANDFNESKMPLLIRALRQGEALFSNEEKRVIMQGTKS